MLKTFPIILILSKLTEVDFWILLRFLKASCLSLNLKKEFSSTILSIGNRNSKDSLLDGFVKAFTSFISRDYHNLKPHCYKNIRTSQRKALDTNSRTFQHLHSTVSKILIQLQKLLKVIRNS